MIVAGACNRRVQVRVRNRNTWTAAQRRRFLVSLGDTCNVRLASKAAGICYRTAYRLRERDVAFATAWADALAAGYERLESELLSRALGDASVVRDPVSGTLGAGDQVSGDRVSSDRADVRHAAVDTFDGQDGGGDAEGDRHAFDPDLALKVLANRTAASRGESRRRGGTPIKHVSALTLEATLLRQLDMVARRLLREDLAAHSSRPGSAETIRPT